MFIMKIKHQLKRAWKMHHFMTKALEMPRRAPLPSMKFTRQLINTPCYSVYTRYFHTNAAARLNKAEAAGRASKAYQWGPRRLKLLTSRLGKPQGSDCHGKECCANRGSSTLPGEVFFFLFPWPNFLRQPVALYTTSSALPKAADTKSWDVVRTFK